MRMLSSPPQYRADCDEATDSHAVYFRSSLKNPISSSPLPFVRAHLGALSGALNCEALKERLVGATPGRMPDPEGQIEVPVRPNRTGRRRAPNLAEVKMDPLTVYVGGVG